MYSELKVKIIKKKSTIELESIRANFAAAIANHYNLAFSLISIRYPSLLGGQRRHDMRGLPTTSAQGWRRDSRTFH